MRRGRPRSPEADEAILAAALALVGELGVTGMSMDDVAARAGVSKATIYRRWESKEALVLDALNSGISRFEPVDTGSLPGDLHTYLREITERMRASAKARDLVPHLVSAATANPALQPALDEWATSRARPLRELLQRAIRRGELPEDADVDLTIDVIIGAITHRRLFSGELFDLAGADRLAEYVLRAVGARPAPGSAGQQ